MIDTVPSVGYAEIVKAAKTLEGIAKRTPVFTCQEADEQTGAKLFFKCENFQHMGAFKFRGAYNAMANLSELQKKQGVVAFSSGNHAAAIAYSARLLKVKATVVMPTDAPAIKVANTRKHGAKIILYDKHKEDREVIAAQLVSKLGLTLIPPYDNEYILGGQGTAAKEFIEEVGKLDYLFVGIGGGGLLSGSAIMTSHLLPNCVIYGVEPEKGNDAQQSFRSGKIVSIPIPDTIADGARTQHIGEIVLPILQKFVKDIITVSDAQLCAQMKFFAEEMKMIVEPTGCLAAAAVLNKVVDVTGARVGIIVSGGNIDLERYSRLVDLDNNVREKS